MIPPQTNANVYGSGLRENRKKKMIDAPLGKLRGLEVRESFRAAWLTTIAALGTRPSQNSFSMQAAKAYHRINLEE